MTTEIPVANFLIFYLHDNDPGSEKFDGLKNQEASVTQKPKSDLKVADPQNDDLKSHLKAIGTNTTWVLVVIALCAESVYHWSCFFILSNFSTIEKNPTQTIIKQWLNCLFGYILQSKSHIKTLKHKFSNK